jgi:uncharacterized RDD family membrane protein YckC
MVVAVKDSHIGLCLVTKAPEGSDSIYNSLAMANTSTSERKRRRRKRGATQATAQSSHASAPATTSKTVDGAFPINIASPLKRLYAFAIDVLVLWAMIVATKAIFGDLVWHPDAGAQDIFILFGYFVIPTGLFGRTPGKWAAGIRVVDLQGRTPGVAIAIPREMIGRFVATISLGIGLAWAVFDPKRQGWHDKIAGTLVINTPDSGGFGFIRRWMKIEPK